MVGRWIFGVMGGVGGIALALAAWATAPRQVYTGASADVVRELADRILAQAPARGVIVLGEDHRSPLPDAIGAALIRRGAVDCLLLELHEDLQPALDQFVAGGKWTRTVKPALRMAFGVEPLAEGQDRQAVRTARKEQLGMYAVDAFPRRLMQQVRIQKAYGSAMSPQLRRQVIDDRDAAMAASIGRLYRSGTCGRAVYTVGWNHLPGLVRRLVEDDVPAWGTVVDHAVLPPLPDPLTARWEAGRIVVE